VAVRIGAEIDSYETLWIGRIGAEYAFELPNAWESWRARVRAR